MTEFEQKVADALASAWERDTQGHSFDGIWEWCAPRVAAAIGAAITKAWNTALVSRGHVSGEVADQGSHDSALAALRGGATP